MNLYQYVASNNPYTAKNIIESFGYEVTDKTQMGENLRYLVAMEGEPALERIMAEHPEKDVILEMFSKKESQHTSCDCKSCKDKSLVENFMNASGAGVVEQQKTDNNLTPVIFLAGVMLIVITLLKK
jgi:hypothetical protein